MLAHAFFGMAWSGTTYSHQILDLFSLSPLCCTIMPLSTVPQDMSLRNHSASTVQMAACQMWHLSAHLKYNFSSLVHCTMGHAQFEVPPKGTQGRHPMKHDEMTYHAQAVLTASSSVKVLVWRCKALSLR